MKLDLNIKEWVALYGLLERQVPVADKHLAEVYNKCKSQLITIMTMHEREVVEDWFSRTQQKVDDLKAQNQSILDPLSNILTDDEEPAHRQASYPKKSAHRRVPRK